MPIFPLQRLFDNAEAIERQGREKKAEVRYQTAEADGDPPTFACRVCDRRAPEPRFCSVCLAETMEPLRRDG